MGLSKGASAAETKKRLLTESHHIISEKERITMSENKSIDPKLEVKDEELDTFLLKSKRNDNYRNIAA